MIQQIKSIVNDRRLNLESYVRKVQMRMNINKNDVEHLLPTYHCVKKWYGNSYGGFYVIPDLIHSNSIVYSFGIGKDISFDIRMIKEHKCHVYGFDPTPKSIQFIQNLRPNAHFHFYDYGISTGNRIEKFFLPIHNSGVSGSLITGKHLNQKVSIEVNMKRLDEIARSFGHTHIDVLKLDIEGSEYDVLESIVNMDIGIKQLLVEFHDRFFENEIKSKKSIEMLKQNGFEIFGASLNYEEISLINTTI